MGVKLSFSHNKFVAGITTFLKSTNSRFACADQAVVKRACATLLKVFIC